VVSRCQDFATQSVAVVFRHATAKAVAKLTIKLSIEMLPTSHTHHSLSVLGLPETSAYRPLFIIVNNTQSQDADY